MRVAILGASGFGRFHAREFHRAGARVQSILGSRPASAAGTAARLASDFGIEAQPFADLAELLATPHDVVSVCTPHELHFEHTCAALDAGAFVLCEKPLVWHDGLSVADSEALLAELERRGARERLGLNTLNVHFVDELARRARLPSSPCEVVLRFHTQGTFEREGIAIDLLPHALSILQRLVPGGSPADVRSRVERRRVALSFRWAEVSCELDLREDPGGEKLLAWSVDGTEFRRESDEVDGRYRVVLREAGVAEPYPIEDPLTILIGRFLASARGTGRPSVDFDDAAAIQRGMTALLARS